MSSEVQQYIPTGSSNGTIKRFALPTPHQDEDNDYAMAIDDAQQSFSSSFSLVQNKDIFPEMNVPSGQMPTPPLSDLLSLSPTPVPHIQVSKAVAADIIADIKAQAYAKSLTSPDLDDINFDNVDFNIELDSSDEDLPVLPLAPTKVER